MFGVVIGGVIAIAGAIIGQLITYTLNQKSEANKAKKETYIKLFKFAIKIQVDDNFSEEEIKELLVYAKFFSSEKVYKEFKNMWLEWLKVSNDPQNRDLHICNMKEASKKMISIMHNELNSKKFTEFNSKEGKYNAD